MNWQSKKSILRFGLGKCFYFLGVVGSTVSFDVVNGLSQEISLSWFLLDYQKSANIKPGSRKTFILYLPPDQDVLELSAIVKRDNKRVLIDGEKIYELNLQNPSNRTRALVVTGKYAVQCPVIWFPSTKTTRVSWL